MESNTESLFKNKRERIARLQKGSVNPTVKKVPRGKIRVSSSDEDDEDFGSVKDLKKTGAKVVACGDVLVRNETSLPSESSVQVTLAEDCESEEASHIKLKLKLGDTKFYGLKPRSKPGDLNEEIIFARNLRNAVKFNDGLKQQWRGSRVKKDTKRNKDEKHPCFGSISKKGRWSFDTPAPDNLLELHRQNFGLDEENMEEDEGGPTLYLRPNGTVVDWDYFLTSDPRNLKSVPPVTAFKWAPFADIWSEIAKPGLCIELRNPFIPGDKEVYWIGTIVHFAGYRALVKFETFDFNPTNPYMAWISFCSDVPKPLGWCKKTNKELKPGPVIKGMGKDQISECVEEISARPTINPDHCVRLSKQIQKLQEYWKPAVPVEAMDVCSLHENRLARITAVVGDRVHVSFHATNEEKEDYGDGYWFHYQSEDLHPLFWTQTVGMVLNGVSENTTMPDFGLPVETFPPWPADKVLIQEGMKLEAIHPYLTNKIVGAVIVKVLNHGYFEIQTREENTFSRLHFVYHVTSPYVLPWGFGSKHGIEVDFKDNSIEAENNKYLNLEALAPRPEHTFQIGDKVEAFECSNTSFLGAASVKKIAAHLLLLHFDSWPEEVDRNYQWVGTQSTEIYPIGYSQMLGLKWQGGG